MKAGKVKKIRF